jgi:hypothetical protein
MHGPFSRFLLEEKEKMGGCIAPVIFNEPAIFMAVISPARRASKSLSPAGSCELLLN